MIRRIMGGLMYAAAAVWVCGISAAQSGSPDVAVSILSDPGANMTIGDARDAADAGSFQAIEGAKSPIGFIEGALWVKVDISGHSGAPHLILETPSPRVTYVDFYERGRTEPLRAGAGYPFAFRPLQWLTPAFPILVAPGSDKTVFLRIRDTGDYTLEVKLWQWRSFVRHATTYMLEHGAVAGMLFVLTLFNGGIFLVLRERGYLSLAAFLAAYFLFYSAHEGIGPFILWPNWPWLGERATVVFAALGLLTGTALARELLDIPEDSPRLRRTSRAWMWGLGLVLAVTLTAPPEWRSRAVLYSGLLTPIAVVALGIASYRRGGKSALFFLRIWSLLAAGVFIVALGGLGVIPGVPTVQVFSYAIVLSTVAWSFELAWCLRARELELRTHLAAAVAEKSAALTTALGEMKALETLLPICSHCKKIRDDAGQWQPIEKYLRETAEADLTHGICPDCAKEWYPGVDLMPPDR